MKITLTCARCGPMIDDKAGTVLDLPPDEAIRLINAGQAYATEAGAPTSVSTAAFVPPSGESVSSEPVETATNEPAETASEPVEAAEAVEPESKPARKAKR